MLQPLTSRTAFAQVPSLEPHGLGAAQDARALERHDRVLDRIERDVISGHARDMVGEDVV